MNKKQWSVKLVYIAHEHVFVASEEYAKQFLKLYVEYKQTGVNALVITETRAYDFHAVVGVTIGEYNPGWQERAVEAQEKLIETMQEKKEPWQE